mgnify:CR=1 FL=1
MKYTIKVNELNKESNIKAMASVVFGDSFRVGNIAVVERKDGELFVVMPQFRSNSKDKYGNDVYKSVCNPITKEFRQELFDNILATYASEQNEKQSIQKMEMIYSLRYRLIHMKDRAVMSGELEGFISMIISWSIMFLCCRGRKTCLWQCRHIRQNRKMNREKRFIRMFVIR